MRCGKVPVTSEYRMHPIQDVSSFEHRTSRTSAWPAKPPPLCLQGVEYWPDGSGTRVPSMILLLLDIVPLLEHRSLFNGTEQRIASPPLRKEGHGVVESRKSWGFYPDGNQKVSDEQHPGGSDHGCRCFLF